MQKISREKVQFLIDSNKKSIKSHSAKLVWAGNLNIRVTELAKHKRAIRDFLAILREHHKELLPFVKKIKSNIADITESTHICAIYLLLCHVFDNWNSFFLLIENGRHSVAGSLLRMIKEADMQIRLFVAEFSDGDRTNLDKWLRGDIVGHVTGRKKINKDLEKVFPQIDGEKLDAHIYQVESQVPHNSYSSMLESISPFTEDFDFEGYTGFYRASVWARYATMSLVGTNISMKAVYMKVIRDKADLVKLNKILMKYFPDANEKIDVDSVKEFLK